MALFLLDAPATLVVKAGKVGKFVRLASEAKTVEQRKKYIDMAFKLDPKIATATINAQVKGKTLAKEYGAVRGFLKQNKYLLVSHTANVNRIINDRIEEKKKLGLDPTISKGELLGIWAMELPFTMLDKAVDLDILKNSKVGKAVKAAVDLQPKTIKAKLLYGVAKEATKLMVDGAEEAAQSQGGVRPGVSLLARRPEKADRRTGG
jgi:tellurite resistance protein